MADIDNFFSISKRKRIMENKHAFSIYDLYPVSIGHSLIIPKRKVKEVFDLTNEEYLTCFELVKKMQKYLKKKYKPDGFNVGINCGKEAGQTIFHAHIHIIPRYKGDVKNPRGGVRNVIPKKGNYSIK